ncbi:MAG: DUF3881 family protein [Lachnospiraceae bacterium]
MHKFLSAIGFSQIKTRKQMQTLIRSCTVDDAKKNVTSNGENSMLVEFQKEFADGMGLIICGEFDEENNFMYDYFFPYLKGNSITTSEDISIERHAARESYAGICDDVRIGVTLIFYLQNMVSYVKIKNMKQLPIKGTSLIVSGLSLKGTIMMPIKKNDKDKETIKKDSLSRNQLLQAAKRGDEEAIESLTLDDIDTYTAISKKIHTEDIFTIVDTYFMPYGVECDQYSILGEILNFNMVSNYMTNENIYVMTLNCNDLIFDVCINVCDLLGEPKIGRRFKGIIWIQGEINFPE